MTGSIGFLGSLGQEALDSLNLASPSITSQVKNHRCGVFMNRLRRGMSDNLQNCLGHAGKLGYTPNLKRASGREEKCISSDTC